NVGGAAKCGPTKCGPTRYGPGRGVLRWASWRVKTRPPCERAGAGAVAVSASGANIVVVTPSVSVGGRDGSGRSHAVPSVTQAPCRLTRAAHDARTRHKSRTYRLAGASRPGGGAARK